MATQLCLGKISEDFSVANMKKTVLIIGLLQLIKNTIYSQVFNGKE